MKRVEVYGIYGPNDGLLLDTIGNKKDTQDLLECYLEKGYRKDWQMIPAIVQYQVPENGKGTKSCQKK